MALPSLKTTNYELEIPSLSETVSYRPFLVKEQKQLMIASEGNDQKEIMKAVCNLISSCVEMEYDPMTLPMFDIEYIFTKLRSKSVGSNVTLKLLCPDDNETYATTAVDLDDVEVSVSEEHTNVINLTDDIGLTMSYPTIKDTMNIESESNNVDQSFKLINFCIMNIFDKETVYDRANMTEKEVSDFIDEMNVGQLQKVQSFFETMPKTQLKVNVTNPKTGVESEIVLEGMQNFLE